MMIARQTDQSKGAPRSKTRRGAATVEMAMVLPVMLTILLGVIEEGRWVQVQQILTNAAREGARQAASGEMNSTAVSQAVKTYVLAAGLPTNQLTITVSNQSSPGTDPTNATCLDHLQVTVTIPFSAVRWCDILLVSSNSTVLSATANWYSGNSLVYPSSFTVPAGF